MSVSTPNFKRTKFACYTAYFTMASIFSLPPILFVTFHENYGISYTLLGTLVLINFFTQLGVDLVFTLFSKRLGRVDIITKVMPIITSLGLVIYAVIPWLFPRYAYLGLVIGTVIFSVSAGLSEVLLSPTIAAIPSDTPQRDMSMLHSLYAFGVLTVVILGAVFLRVFGTENWMYLTLILAALPVVAAVLFMISPMPDMEKQETTRTVGYVGRRVAGLVICALCIFFGSCAENAMSNWISGYMEKALHIDKMVGDIVGMAMFAVLLGLARVGYARFGKRIHRTLLIGMIGAAVCYLIAGLSNSVILPLIACVLTGLFTAMLWPGTLIMMEENVPGADVAAFALMAASGDLGASVAPQLLGIITDRVAASELAAKLSTSGMTAEQVGMKTGMLVTAVFPLLGVGAVLAAIMYFKLARKTK